MRRLNGTQEDLQKHIDYWFRQPQHRDKFGAVQAKGCGRLGQYIWNQMGVGSWPELFYCPGPQSAIGLAYAEFMED